MIHEYYKELQNNQNIRENLESAAKRVQGTHRQGKPCCLWWRRALLTGLLESDEPKVQNAALLLGSLAFLQTSRFLFSCIRERVDAVRKECISRFCQG